MAKGYLSNRQKNLKVGISSYTENQTVLEVTGKVGIGTTNATSSLHVVGNTLITGVTTSSGGFVGNLTGIASTAQGLTGTPNISVGILTASSGNFSGIVTSSGLNVSGISTISVNSASDALRINQLGSGNALVVEDETNPDATPFVVRNDGFVGIGTINPISQLHLSGFFTTNSNLKIGSLEFQNYSLNNSFFGDNVYWNGSAMVRRSTGASGLFYFLGDEGQFRLSPSGLQGSETVNSPQLKINSNGGFGIGSSLSQNENNFTGANFYVNPQGIVLVGTISSTGTATQRLQVNGGAYFAGVGVATGSIGIGITNPQGTIDIRTSPQWSGFNWGANLVIGGTRNNALGILDSTNSNPWAIANGAGNLLIAPMPPIGDTTTNMSNAMQITRSGNVLISAESSTGTVNQQLQVSGGAYISGNLGIGTTNPGTRLHVQGTGTEQFWIRNGSAYLYAGHTGDRARIGGWNSSTGATNLVLNDAGGNTGIGTTNPVATLQVKDALAFETTNTTTTTTNQVAVDTFATATLRSAKYQVQVTCPGQIATLGGITTGGRGYTAGTYNVTFTTSSGTGSAAQGTLTVSNGTVGQISVSAGGTGYVTGDVLTASGGSGLQVSVASTGASGAITGLTLTSSGIGYTAGVGVGTTTLAFLGGTGFNAVGLATIFDGVITSSTLLQQPTTGTGGTVFYSGSNYTTSSVLSVDRTALTNTITTITGSVGVSTFTSLTAHGLFVNDIIRTSSTSNGLTAGTNYFVVSTPTSTTFTLGTSLGVGVTFTTGTSLSIDFYRNSANAGGQVNYTNAITGVSTNFQASDLMVLQSGTTADFIEYATIANNDVLGTFAADISGANARLLFTPTYPDNNIKVARQAITV